MADEHPEIVHRFAFHPANTPARQEAHEAVRAGCMDLAITFMDLLPDGRERSLALTKLEECMFWGNAAVARAT